MGAPKEKFPLFHIDLTLNEIDKLVYSTSPKQVVMDILKVFQHGVKQLQEIPQVEQKLLPHLFKSNQKNYLKATLIPDSRPEEPDPDDPKAMADENAWIYELKARLMDKISTIIEPMEEYFKTYAKFEKENDMLSPEREMAKYDDPENWPPVDELRGMILTHKREAQRLMGEIPEEKIVSCFKISTKVIRDLMIAKHEKMASAKIELIAKVSKQMANKILRDFEEHNHKVEGTPKGIEELSELKDYMNGLPMELEKKQIEIKACMKNYGVLDEFHYRWDDDEEYDKLWRVYGAPLETVQRIEKQQGFLEKEKDRFVKQMEAGKT